MLYRMISGPDYQKLAKEWEKEMLQQMEYALKLSLMAHHLDQLESKDEETKQMIKDKTHHMLVTHKDASLCILALQKCVEFAKAKAEEEAKEAMKIFKKKDDNDNDDDSTKVHESSTQENHFYEESTPSTDNSNQN